MTVKVRLSGDTDDINQLVKHLRDVRREGLPDRRLHRAPGRTAPDSHALDEPYSTVQYDLVLATTEKTRLP